MKLYIIDQVNFGSIYKNMSIFYLNMIFHFDHRSFSWLMSFIHLIIAKMSYIHHQRLKT
ncbi:Hypothetical protein LOCK919_2507 [Lacticaseibacillus paracasei]|nr:Hypothetical protein LOCK919_2507 [Lacticaseibacillus paracasei]